MKPWMVALVLVALLNPAKAQTTQQQSPSAAEVRAMNATQQDMTTCTAFFIAGTTCVGGGDLDLAQRLEQAGFRLFNMSRQLGASVGMTEDAMDSRMQTELSGMRTLMASNCVNVASILARYAERCRMVLNQPEDIFKEHLTGR